MATPRRSNRAVWRTVFLLGLVVGAAAVSFWGIRSMPLPTVSTSAPPADAPTASIVSIAMPHEEPLPPLGPHRSTFQTSCTICHSTRLALNQPPFAAERWHQIVEKMVTVYGAQVNATQQKEIVAYLTAISERKTNDQSSAVELAAVGRSQRVTATERSQPTTG